VQGKNIWLYNTSCIGVNCSGESGWSRHSWKIMLKHAIQKWSGSVWTASVCFWRGINDRLFWAPWLVTGCHRTWNFLTDLLADCKLLKYVIVGGGCFHYTSSFFYELKAYRCAFQFVSEEISIYTKPYSDSLEVTVYVIGIRELLGETAGFDFRW